MGAENSSAQYGGVYITLDKEVYNPGDTVTGAVAVDILQPYPGKTLDLRVKGFEMVLWDPRDLIREPGTHRYGTTQAPIKGRNFFFEH